MAGFGNHFHARRDMGEIYYTQSGTGLLLLESREGVSRTVEMKPGVCAFIPPDWAHRSINVGDEPLVFVWACNPEAGHDYAEILKRGMRKRIKAMRSALVQALQAAGVKQDLSFITRQKGMFSYSGLHKAQMERLRGEFGIYGVDSGRICVAALNEKNLPAVTAAIAKVL